MATINIAREAVSSTAALPPVDARIQHFLNNYLADVCPDGAPRLPLQTLAATRVGQAREWSFPPGQNFFESPYVKSYRVVQGVLHNPTNDRRTTQGVFHIAEGGFPIPADKIAVPKRAFASLLSAALGPPPDVMGLPVTATQSERVRLFVTRLLRTLLCHATVHYHEKTMR